MGKQLLGKPVADQITGKVKERVETLGEKNIFPKLAIVRVGENPSDLAYERGAIKRGEMTGVETEVFSYPLEIPQEEMEKELKKINEDENIDGILLFQPLPSHLQGEKLREIISKRKDVDGITKKSMAGLYGDTGEGFPPCTPWACMEILKYYNIPLRGKKVVVLGRSLVIGKPISLLLLKEDATVTICHSKTENLKKITKEADIIVAAMGRSEMINSSYLGNGQNIIDVGINVNEEGKLVGDFHQGSGENLVENYTPVPKGVGGVTTSVLMKHVVESSRKRG